MLQNFLRLLLLTSIAVVSACGGGGGDTTSSSGDTQAPSIVSGGGNQVLRSSGDISIVFSESIDTGSIDFSGTTAISGGSPTAAWSTTTISNDTLTLSGAWVSGDLILDLADAAGNTLSTQFGGVTYQFTITVDDTSPTGSSSPLTDTILDTSSSVVLTYNETVLDSSIVIGGDLQTSAGVPVLSSGTILTIAPSTTWATGDNQTLIVTVTDSAGNSVSDTLTFNVLDGVVYVDGTNGLDTNSGSLALPKLTIQEAITTADNAFTTGDVKVALGTYTESVTLADGISLLGGYVTGFASRDAVTNVTVINSNASASTITASSITTANTLLDGFTINGSSGVTLTSAITYSGSSVDAVGLTISNNIINGGSGSSTSRGLNITGNVNVDNNVINGGTAPFAQAVLAVGGEFAKITPTFSNNTINGGGVGSSGSISYGMSLMHSSSNISGNTIQAGAALTNTGLRYNNGSGDIYNNHIEGGAGTASIGLDIGRFNTSIYNNTIYGGSANFVIAIKMTSESISINSVKLYNNTIDAGSSVSTNYAIAFLGSSSDNDITNNNFIGRNGATTTCLRDMTTSSDALSMLRNNNLFQCDTLYINTNGAYQYTTITALHAATAFTASGNETMNPNVVSATDYHLTATTPNFIRSGGVNLSSEFVTDKDDVARVFSVGAYVYVP